MLAEREPKDFLSKREDGTYCVIVGGMPLNQYSTKEQCVSIANRYGIELPPVIWSAERLSFIEE